MTNLEMITKLQGYNHKRWTVTADNGYTVKDTVMLNTFKFDATGNCLEGNEAAWTTAVTTFCNSQDGVSKKATPNRRPHKVYRNWTKRAWRGTDGAWERSMARKGVGGVGEPIL